MTTILRHGEEDPWDGGVALVEVTGEVAAVVPLFPVNQTVLLLLLLALLRSASVPSSRQKWLYYQRRMALRQKRRSRGQV